VSSFHREIALGKLLAAATASPPVLHKGPVQIGRLRCLGREYISVIFIIRRDLMATSILLEVSQVIPMRSAAL
jgi:hypothetical protein